MKISESWLREWVSPELTTQEIADKLTMAGLEVDSIEAVCEGLSGVVVGQILAVEPHPDADKLRICQVAGQGDPVQVVCGAPNVEVGMKVPFATVGAELPNDLTIKKAKLRGVESFGMLCGADELALGESEGLWDLGADAITGQNLVDYLALDDQVIDIDITPNRSDCLSIRGVARELATLTKLKVQTPVIEPVAATIDAIIDVSIDADEKCPRYCARIIKGIDSSIASPLWLVERLRRAGIGSKSPVVDITNYVLLELGQPMHAFDLKKVSQIVVRDAKAGESITLLNQQTVVLKEGSLLITDGQQPIALAGIMGGLDSAVTDQTTDILLESAFFAPESIAGKARQYGLHTDSSHRFERGVDYQLQSLAIERATAMIIDICGGQPGPIIEKQSDSLPSAPEVSLPLSEIERQLGFAVEKSEVLDIFTRLGLSVVDNGDAIGVIIPSYRFDMSIGADLIEEIARVYGYNNLPSKPLPALLNVPMHSEKTLSQDKLTQTLVARGYHEAITYSFVDPKIQALFTGEDVVDVKNPISNDLAQMRTNLWVGLAQAAVHNLKRQQTRVRLFESGLKFTICNGELIQKPVLAGLVTGKVLSEKWCNNNALADFYDVKADVEALLNLGNQAASFKAGSHLALHPGQTASISRADQEIGLMGALHPEIQKKLGFSQPVFLFELDLKALLTKSVTQFEVLSKYPEVRRDIAIVVDQSLPVRDLEEVILQKAGEHLINLKVFDVYTGEGIDPHRKSIALGLTFQHKSRTLTEEEISETMDQVVKSLEASFSAVLR